MTDSKIFLDTAPFIYLLDNDEKFTAISRCMYGRL